MKRFFEFLRWGVFATVFVLCALCCVNAMFMTFGVELTFLAWLPAPGSGLYMIGALFPFATDETLTAIAIGYKNDQFIADEVFPRKPVGKREFKYRLFAKGQYLTRPETLVSRTGAPNRVELNFTEEASSCVDYGLDDHVPVDDINNAPANYDPEGAAIEFIAQLILLDREIRAAAAAFSTANYAAGNQVTLSGTDQFSHASSTPITTLLTAIDACFYRPTHAVMGYAVWQQLRKHADIVKAATGSTTGVGLVNRRQFADLLELDDVYVGRNWYNSAKPGQTPTVARLWGKSMLFFFKDPSATPVRGMTFAVTAQFGDRFGNRIEDQDAGLRGGIRVRAGESVKELILANDLGYLIDAAVA